MQLKIKLSFLTTIALATSSLIAEDYVSVQLVHYDEDSGRTTVLKPSIEVNKDFGADYSLNVNFVSDTISGASPTFYDTNSGASAYSRGFTNQENIVFDDIKYDDDRVAAGTMLTTRFANRDELITGLNYSYENDYASYEISGEYLHWLDESKNRSISFGLAYQFNEIATTTEKDDDDDDDDHDDDYDTDSGASQTMDLNVINAEIGFTQIINKNSLIKTSLFYSNEDGYLNNSYMNVVRDYYTNPQVVIENKPDSRVAYGATLQYIISLNNKTSLNSKYRYYSDDWDINSHTISSDLYYEYNDRWIFGTGIRYYTQSKAKFYSGKKDFFTNEKYASSDRRVSDFDAINYKLSADYRVNEKISVNVGANYYDQRDIFSAVYYNAGLKYRF